MIESLLAKDDNLHLRSEFFRIDLIQKFNIPRLASTINWGLAAGQSLSPQRILVG